MLGKLNGTRSALVREADGSSKTEYDEVANSDRINGTSKRVN